MNTGSVAIRDRAPSRLREPPRRWRWLIRGFRRYVRRYLARHFHAVRLSRSGNPLPTDRSSPLLVVLNHPSWWDPLIGVFLSGLLPQYEHFAFIDAKALGRYRFFSRLGFLGIELDSYRGAADFLRYGISLLSRPGHAVWVTAQGHFADVRTRPLRLEPGVGHLAVRLNQGLILPVALEYPFWTERTPEALIRIGTPLAIESAPPGRSAQEWTEIITQALEETMDALALEAASQQAERFITLLCGRSGVGGWYGFWQRMRAFFKGETYRPEHAAIMHREGSGSTS
jgi:1-acyl-sn-glycerol-3-phosphate acyltransferase